MQEELVRICTESLGTDLSKIEGFILALTILEPYLRAIGELQPWFDFVLSTLLDAQSTKKSLVQQTQEFVFACITYNKEAYNAKERTRSSKVFIAKVLTELLKRTAALTDATLTTSLLSQNRAQQQLQDLIVHVGRLHTRDLFSAFEDPLVDPSTRFHALQVMSIWLKQQHPHLYLISKTGVVDLLLKCLMNDRSTILISVALQNLLMLLPHIPATVASQLPRLFLIYSRCLCWEKFSVSSTQAEKDLVTDDSMDERPDDDDSGQLFSIDEDWKTIDSVPDAPEKSVPELLGYFTYLYGLYPLNFTSYIRRPRKYLKQIDFPGADDFDLDQAIIHSRTEQFQRVHLLHPALFSMTAEEELADNRWLKAEPEEVVATCLGLYSGSQTLLNAPPTQTVASTTSLPETDTELPRPTPLSPDRLLSPTSETAESSSLLSLAPSTDSLAPRPTYPLNSDIVYLQRELLVTRNELNFERYLKEQHAAAISQLKRDRIKAVTVEAETATLINSNRRLQRKLTETTKFNEKLQKETQSRKTHARQSEDQLNGKIRTLRSALADQQGLETSLQKANTDIEALRQLVVESEARELKAREKADGLEAQSKEIEPLQAEVARLRQEAQTYNDRIAELNRLNLENKQLRQNMETSRAMASTQDRERERSKKVLQSRIEALEARLDTSEPRDESSDEDRIKTSPQRELEESRARYVSIQRAWIKANRELQELRIRYDELLRAARKNLEHGNGTGMMIPDDREGYMWRGPPVGAPYGQPDGPVGGYSLPLHGGHPIPKGAFSVRDTPQRQDDLNALSRSEGSTGQRNGFAEWTVRAAASRKRRNSGSRGVFSFENDSPGLGSGGFGTAGLPRTTNRSLARGKHRELEA